MTSEIVEFVRDQLGVRLTSSQADVLEALVEKHSLYQDTVREAVENPERVVPRLEVNACFARPYRVVTRNASYDTGMVFKAFKDLGKARKYLERQRFKQARLRTMRNWKVVTDA